MSSSSSSLQLSTAITRTFRQLRRLLTRYVATQGLLWIALWLLLVFWLGGLIDYLPVTMGSSETPGWLRAGLLAMMLFGSGLIGYRWIVARLWVKLENKSLALLIERHYPELNNELITAVELGDAAPGPDVSNPLAHRKMLQRVHQSAEQHIAVVRPIDMFDWQPLWSAGIAAALGLSVTAVAVLGMPEWTGRWARRLFTLADEPWPRRAALRADGLLLQVPAFSTQLSAERVLVPFVDSVARVPQGAAPQLQISADARAQQVPEVCTMFYQSADGTRGRANLRRIGSPRNEWQSFTLEGPPLDGLTHNMQIDVLGLDARLRDLDIEVVQPAVVADMQLSCVYPSYLLDSFSVRGQQETIQYRSGLAIPEGTEVTLVGTASHPLRRVEYMIQAPTSESASETKPEAPSILSSAPDGLTFRVPLGQLTASQVVEIRLIDQYGLSAEQIPRYVITMREDTIPEVATQLEGIGLAITANAQLPITGTVIDDHGIEQVSLELGVAEAPPLAITLALEETQLTAIIDLEQLAEQQQISLAPGMNLGLVVSAQDYYDLGDKSHVGRGQSVQLSVVTPDQLLVILDRQELELRQRFELIVSELEQLRPVLQTMKTDLPATSGQIRLQPAPGSTSPVVGYLQEASRESPTQVAQRLAGLWSQQSVLQADKSQQELSSVAARVDNLRMQLINNRIESYDRQQRLQDKVGLPLRSVLANEYEALRRALAAMQTAALAGGGRESAQVSAQALEAVLLKLEEIKASMQDIEDFNEIIDLVRGLLEDQEKVLGETEQQQRQRILDLLR
jgi:hypothetical protein